MIESSGHRDAEAGKPYPGERQTWLSGAWTTLFVGIVALVVILVFILQREKGNLVSTISHCLFVTVARNVANIKTGHEFFLGSVALNISKEISDVGKIVLVKRHANFI